MMSPVKSIGDLNKRCQDGDMRYQALAIVALSNIGGEHLAEEGSGPDWEKAVFGLRQYWCSLVGEYGIDEEAAEEQLVDEINFVRNCVHVDKEGK